MKIRCLAFSLAGSAAAATALAQTPGPYSQRPVRMIAAQSAGSSLDTILRIFVDRMSELMGQQIVVDNRSGAGGTIGVELAARSSADGYTLLADTSRSMIVSSFAYTKLAFNTLKDFVPISPFANVESVFVVNPTLPVKSVGDFIALAKARPGKLMMGSAGVGASSHLAGLRSVSLTQIQSTRVPYTGGGPMATAIVANEAQSPISPAAALVGVIRAGRLRAITIASAKRSPILPDLPTAAESGVPAYEFSSWNGVVAPAGTPRSIIQQVHRVMVKTATMNDVKEQFASQGLAPSASASPEEFATLIRADYTTIGKVVTVAGIKPA